MSETKSLRGFAVGGQQRYTDDSLSPVCQNDGEEFQREFLQAPNPQCAHHSPSVLGSHISPSKLITDFQRKSMFISAYMKTLENKC